MGLAVFLFCVLKLFVNSIYTSFHITCCHTFSSRHRLVMFRIGVYATRRALSANGRLPMLCNTREQQTQPVPKKIEVFIDDQKVSISFYDFVNALFAGSCRSWYDDIASVRIGWRRHSALLLPRSSGHCR
jgi:hypothetical protein